jgi:hypothetical protein
MSTGIDAINVGAPISATGGLAYAPLDATLPADAREALEQIFTRAGYISEDGLTRTTDASDEKIKAWGGDTIKIVRTEHSVTYSGAFMESANAEVLKLLHGDDNVIITPASATAGGQIKVLQTKEIPPRMSFVLDMVDGDALLREVIPNGQITTTGDVVFVHSDVIRYEFSIECFPVAHEGKDGVKAISLKDDGKINPGV